MKILFLSSTSFSDCDIKIVNELVKHHQLTYAAFIPVKDSNFERGELKELLDNDIRFYPVITKYRRRDFRNIPLLKKLIFFIKTESYDIIYLQDYEDIYFMLLFRNFFKNTKVVFGLHDVISHSEWKQNWLLNAVKNWFLKKVHYFLSYSTIQADALKKRFPTAKVFEIPLGLKDFGLQPSKGTGSDVVSFLFFGNISSYKGLDLLLTATQNLYEKYTSFELVIAGRCPDWDSKYKPLIKTDNYIKLNIRFIHNHEIPTFFAHAHYLVLPYYDVTQSGPLMIAYNYNVPVIASDLDGFKEFTEVDTTGLLFKAGDAVALEKVLETAVLQSNNEYQQLKIKLGAYVQKRFSPETIAAQFNNMFISIYSTQK